MTGERLTGTSRRFYRFALVVFGHLPMALRRFVIRVVTPSWSAGAAAIVERDDGRWLMVRPVYRKGWALPGGFLDRSELPAVAVVREMREELGLEIVLDPEPWVIHDSMYRRLDVIFRARLLDGVDPDSVAIRTPELDQVGWFDPDDPPLLEHEAHDILKLREAMRSSTSPILMR